MAKQINTRTYTKTLECENCLFVCQVHITWGTTIVDFIDTAECGNCGCIGTMDVTSDRKMVSKVDPKAFFEQNGTVMLEEDDDEDEDEDEDDDGEF